MSDKAPSIVLMSTAWRPGRELPTEGTGIFKRIALMPQRPVCTWPVGSSFWPFQLLLAQTVLGVLFLWLALLFQMRDREAAMPEERDFGELDPTLTVFLIVITCGLFGVYWHWRLTGGLGRLTGRVDLIPWLDLLMVFATFGLWNFWAQYRNASALEEALDERGRHDALRGAVATAWVLSLFCGPAALFVPWKLQDAYNELVRDLTPPI